MILFLKPVIDKGLSWKPYYCVSDFNTVIIYVEINAVCFFATRWQFYATVVIFSASSPPK